MPLSKLCRVFDAWAADGAGDAPPHDLYEPLEVASHVDLASSLIAWRDATEPLLAFDQKLLEVAIRVMAADYEKRTPGAPTLDAKGADALAAAILLRYGVGPNLDSEHLDDREAAALRCLVDLTTGGIGDVCDHDVLATVFSFGRVPFGFLPLRRGAARRSGTRSTASETRCRRARRSRCMIAEYPGDDPSGPDPGRRAGEASRADLASSIFNVLV